MHRAHVAGVALILVAAAGALAFRLPRLDLRPMHTDEAVHAVKAGELLETGRYTYDPNEYHGPTPYYFALPLIRLFGVKTFAETNETMFRMVPALFGVALVLLLVGVWDALGPLALVCAGMLTAVSPAMTFYSRYYIQETLLVFFTFAVIVCGWRYACSPKLRWALLAGASLGFMCATKETCVLAFGCMAGAAAFVWVHARCGHPSRSHSDTRAQGFRARDHPRKAPAEVAAAPPRRGIRGVHIALAVGTAVLVSALFLSGFFTNLRGPLGAVHAYLRYVGRAAADATRNDGAAYHVHPWHYYLSTLLYFKNAPGPWWSEAMIVVLAVVGAVAAGWFPDRAVPGNRRFVRFLACYTVLMTVAYAAIPYKTPWCLLGFLHGMILLAGVGVASLVRLARYVPLRALVGVGFAAGALHLGVQAYRANFVYYADTRNPYVYAHTSTDVLRLAQRVNDLAELHPDGRAMLVKVMAPGADYWPLPWYLRRLQQVGYWTYVPDTPDAPVVIASVELEDALAGRLCGLYQQEYYGLRPEVLLTVYIRSDLWATFMESRARRTRNAG